MSSLEIVSALVRYLLAERRHLRRERSLLLERALRAEAAQRIAELMYWQSREGRT